MTGGICQNKKNKKASKPSIMENLVGLAHPVTYELGRAIETLKLKNWVWLIHCSKLISACLGLI
jgi:hypothetical protein